MALSTYDLIGSALPLIRPGASREEAAQIRDALAGLVNDALKQLGLAVAGSDDPALVQSLRKDFTLTIAGGTASIAGLMAEAEPPVFATLTDAEIFSSGSVFQWQSVPDRTALTMEDTGTEFIYYCVAGDAVYTTAANGNGVARANFIPLIGSLKPEHQPMMVAILVASYFKNIPLVKARQRAARAQQQGS